MLIFALIFKLLIGLFYINNMSNITLKGIFSSLKHFKFILLKRIRIMDSHNLQNIAHFVFVGPLLFDTFACG